MGTKRTVAEVMSWPAPIVAPETRISSALAYSAELGASHLLVGVDTLPIGVLCLDDLTRVSKHTRAVEIARRAPLVSSLDSPERAALLMDDADVCAIPVIVTGELSGVLTRDALVEAGIDRDWLRCDACRGYHRVRPYAGADVAFCEGCLDGMKPFDFDEVYVDLGYVD